MITKFIVALLCAAVWHGPAQAAGPAKKRDLYYSGEREFCLRLLINANKAAKIEPVIGPTHITDIDEGELYAPKIRLYIVKSPMPIPVIYKLIKQRQWMTLLGYTPRKAISSAGRMITDPRWRKYDDQCPGIFGIHGSRDPGTIVATPTRMTLFDFDADGDGKRDKLYRSSNDYDFIRYAAVDFKTCELKELLWISVASDFFRFEDKTYVITDSAPFRRHGSHMVSVYRINTSPAKSTSTIPMTALAISRGSIGSPIISGINTS